MYLESRRAFVRVMCECYKPGLTIPALYVVHCIVVIETSVQSRMEEEEEEEEIRRSLLFSLYHLSYKPK